MNKILSPKFYLGLTISALLIAIVYGLYFLIFTLPQIASVKLLHNTKTDLQTQYFTLQTNRIAQTDLFKLDPIKPDFLTQKDNLLTTLTNSNERGLKQTDNNLRLNRFASSDVKSLMLDINKNYPALISTQLKAYQDQTEIINTLKTFDQIFSDIYLYDPILDLSSNDLLAEKDDLLERSNLAINGIKKARKDLNAQGIKNSDQAQFDATAQKLITDFEGLRMSLEIADTDSFDIYLENINFDVADLKNFALAVELSPIKSDQGLTILTQQTNLINTYENYIDQITLLQQNFNAK